MLHVLAYFVLGAQLIWIGADSIQLTPLGVLWFWPALCFCEVGVAYLVSAPQLLGKRPDGTHSMVSRIALAPFHGALLLSDLLFALRHQREVAAHEIRPGLWLGRRPSEDGLPEGTSLVVDLTAEHSGLGPREGRSYITLPTMDGRAPSRAGILELVDAISSHDGVVYVHCFAGRGRSATVVAAQLLAEGLASSVDEAEAFMKEHRSQVSLLRDQRETLRELLESQDSDAV